MTIERGVGRHRIGTWDFLPASGELRRRSDVRRLEPRAAKALHMLCDAGGDVVTHEQLIASVWGGRSLSENNVAVVIGQLRRALEDDAKVPRLIETIPKRGYRLVAGASSSPVQGATRRQLGGVLVVAAMAAVAAAMLFDRPAAPSVIVTDVTNETGDRSFDRLAGATSELIVTALDKRGFAVRRGEVGDGLRFRSKLVMWNGAPSLGMTATDAGGVVRWSAMTAGSADRVPAEVAVELDRFARAVSTGS